VIPARAGDHSRVLLREAAASVFDFGDGRRAVEANSERILASAAKMECAS